MTQLLSVESVKPSDHLILCCPLLLSYLSQHQGLLSPHFSSCGQSIGASILAPVFPVIQGWFPLGLSGLTSWQSKGLPGVFFSTIIQESQFSSTQHSLWSNSHIHTWLLEKPFRFSSVAQSCPTLCDPMDCSTSGLPVHHQLLEFAQTHVLRVSDNIQPSHPLSSPFPAFSVCQHSFDYTDHCQQMSLLFNMLPRLVIAFLPRSKCLLISWLQSKSAVILEPLPNPRKRLSLFPHLFAMKRWGQMPWF